MPTPYRPMIFISGGGTTMNEVLKSTINGLLYGLVDPAVVISSKSDAGGIAKLHERNKEREKRGLRQIPSTTLNKKISGSEEQLEADLVEAAKLYEATGFIGCGYVRKFPKALIKRFPHFGHNQHPAPLENQLVGFGGQGFYGEVPHEAVMRYAKKLAAMKTPRPFRTYATVHEVTSEYDKGGIIHLSKKVDVIPNWEEAALHEAVKDLQGQVLPHEHQMVIEALANIARAYMMQRTPVAMHAPPPICFGPEERKLFREAMQETREARNLVAA